MLGEMYLAEIITMDGVIDGSKATQNSRIEADRTFSIALIRLTQNDVRAIQLAKAALCRVPSIDG